MINDVTVQVNARHKSLVEGTMQGAARYMLPAVEDSQLPTPQRRKDDTVGIPSRRRNQSNDHLMHSRLGQGQRNVSRRVGEGGLAFL